jgi:tetratricopeptide (TPR) repeat protein
MRVVTIAIAFFTFGQAALAAEVDWEGLRGEARLPKLVLNPQFNYGRTGFYLGSEEPAREMDVRQPDSFKQATLKVVRAFVENWVRNEIKPEARAEWLEHLSDRLKRQPLDLSARYAAAYLLASTGRADEAAREFATLALLQPGNVEIWGTWIVFQHARAVRVLDPTHDLLKFNPLDDWDEPLQRFPTASVDELRQIIRILDDCAFACDLTAGMADADTIHSIRFFRSEAHAVAQLARGYVELREGSTVEPSKLHPERMLWDAMLECAEEAARAQPDNPMAIGGLAFNVIVNATFNSTTSHQNHPFEGAFEEIASPPQLKTLAGALERLQALSTSTDPHVADDAREALGLIYLRLERWQDALACLEQVAKSDPRRECAFESLCCALTATNRTGEIADVCKRRLALEDSPKVRLILARQLANDGHVEEAIEVLRPAIDKYVTNYDLPCTMAAFYLWGSTKAHLDLADKYMEIAAARMTASTPKSDQCYLRTLQAIHAAFTGNADSARRRLKAILAFDEANEHAKRVLEVLGEEN